MMWLVIWVIGALVASIVTRDEDMPISIVATLFWFIVFPCVLVGSSMEWFRNGPYR